MRSVLLLAAQSLILLSTVNSDSDRNSRIDCVCTSTHFVDISFSITCRRNVTQRTENNQNSDGYYTESSVTSCTKGPPPPPDRFYEPVPSVGFIKFHTVLVTWEQAVRICAREGANLAVVNSDEEAKAMAEIFNRHPFLSSKDWINDQAWIGATDARVEGEWLSLRGLTLQEEGWEKWDTGEPNNEGDGEHCAVFNRDMLMTDEPCDTQMAFFCERPA